MRVIWITCLHRVNLKNNYLIDGNWPPRGLLQLTVTFVTIMYVQQPDYTPVVESASEINHIVLLNASQYYYKIIII